MKKIFVNGEWQQILPSSSQIQFPVSQVEPDQSFTIRQMYDNWTKGKPTSPHVFDCTFDEDGFDESDDVHDFDEPPHDIGDVHNEITDARTSYNEAVTEAVERRRKNVQIAKNSDVNENQINE